LVVRQTHGVILSEAKDLCSLVDGIFFSQSLSLPEAVAMHWAGICFEFDAIHMVYY
jgi:hypothetical protein